jgi:phosphate transport system substrate-binding protein
VIGGCGSDPVIEHDIDTEALGIECQGKDSLAAGGATAQANAMVHFVVGYEIVCANKTLDYNSSGSGAGVTEFIGGQIDIGGSDSPLSEEKGEYDRARQRCGGAEAWNLPAVFGPLAITYNLDGVDDLVLDGTAIAKIFNGTIEEWDDGEIAALNPGADLPNEKINVIYRSDESGTTDNFQLYLDSVAGDDWGKGAGKTFVGGVGEGAKGNEQTSAAVARDANTITYNEWSFAKQRDLQIAQVVNSGGGEPVELTAESAGRAIENAEIKGEGNDLVLDLDTVYGAEADGAYPIVLATYEIVCSEYADEQTSQAVKSFLQVAVTDGQEGLEENGYIPVPEAFQEKLLTAIDAIA